MARKPRDPTPAFALRVDRPATPDRVLEIATLFKEISERVTGGGMHDPITMVIHNRNAVAELRGWNPSTQRQLKLVGDLFEDPVGTVRKWGAGREIALEIARFGARLHGEGVSVVRRGRVVATLDEVLVDALRAVGSSSVQRIKGATEITAPVLRFGRSREGGGYRLRVCLDGDTHAELAVLPHLRARAAAASVDERKYTLRIDATWVLEQDGSTTFEPSKSVVTNLAPFEPIGGADFLAAVEQLPDRPSRGRGDDGFFDEVEDDTEDSA